MASSRSITRLRRATVVGALALGAVVAPAAPALAAPVEIPGIGIFEVPGLPAPAPLPAPVPLPGPAVQPVQQSAGEKALQAAQSKIGSPYVYGASGPNAFDCSGLVQWAFSQAGVGLPRTSQAQVSAGAPVSQSDLRPGDIVSFYGGGHSAIYAGNGNVVHAATSGRPVAIAPLSSMPYAGARRV